MVNGGQFMRKRRHHRPRAPIAALETVCGEIVGSIRRHRVAER